MIKLALLVCMLVVGGHAGWADLFSMPYTSTPSVALDISCVDPTDCYIAGGDNGIGAMVYRFNGSVNGELKTCNLTSSKPAILMTVALEGTSGQPKGVAAGLGILASGIIYASDPKTFLPVSDPGTYVGSSQNARVSGPNVLVIGGVLSVSGNSGMNFTNFKIPLVAPGGGWARYGAIGDANTWYVTYGGWPKNNKESLRGTSLHPFSAKYVVDTASHRLVKTKRLPTSHVQKGSYSALIAKTSDAGKTWTAQFSDNSTFYFNAIDCFDATHCVTVAEGFHDDAGVRVMQTTDGKTWNLVFQLNSSATIGEYTFMAVRYVSATDIWVGGGLDLQLSATALFYKSTDGGKTWALDSNDLTNIDFISAIDFTTGGIGYATGATIDDRCTVLRYTP